MKKNISIIAKKLDIGTSTLYQWKKTRPKLYDFLLENSVIQKNELMEYFEKLTEKEQEMYISEIKAKILRREIQE